MRTKLFVMAVVLVAALSVPVAAHHAFSAEFDADQPLKMTGVVTKVEWINPHSWIHLDVRKPDGTVEKWMVEGGAPQALIRRGFNRNSLPLGTEVVVEGYRAKDGSTKANGRNLTLPNGNSLFMGSSGTGAPLDGRDPTEAGGRGRGGANPRD